ncbi:MAG: protein-methionine-sulfoxide reductase heme-binding subunit MsrQ [Limimaricola sp.]|uniref:protein-methionine-sulfoxide reductase heme-binding subunit MsrQ n=1 Tax=Limimaricola sp. TaxID=2211665 RepID=UPI001DA94B10|nr:protein-methionine-sulfoxide reductase heme-binding subunit MsrQ [Limimaricola sp.]MBI1416921.1 protein-methionine-sulfoxide reductase heme-binding subunit MsrQ [Limimaricola sp.]
MDVAGYINRAARRVPPWTLYIAGFGWAAWLFWQAATGAIGVEPVNILERAYGLLSLKLLVAGLCITPLRRLAGINLLRFRRALGLTAFMFLIAHFLVFAVLDVQTLGRVVTEVVKRPYVMVGFAALVMLVPLALTSNNWSIRRMGPVAWRRLHWLVYPAAVLGGLHYVWLVKGWQLPPMVYLGIILALLALRIRLPRAPSWVRAQ